VRERLVLLALLLCAGPAWASSVVEEEETEEPVVPGYLEAQAQAINLSEDVLRISVSNGVLRPSHGYVPLDVTLHNTGPTPRIVRIDLESHGSGRSGSATRVVEVGPRQRLVAWVPFSVTSRGGTVRVRGQDIPPNSFNFYTVDPPGAPVLVLGVEARFQGGTGLPRVQKDPKLSVRFLPPQDAPRELSAYVGYPTVVVASDVAALPADVWATLEAYAATGGHLCLLVPPRDVGERLPLLDNSTPGEHPYGFGRVRLCAEAKGCGAGLLADASRAEADEEANKPVGLLSPIGPPPTWQRRRGQMLHDGAEPLLPGVQAPVGRFLLLITLFVLLVGPGGLALARRKGPVALLIAVPSVALVTCLAIISYSVLVEGFSVHAARYSVTLLDRARDRALTAGLNGYYANLEPEGVRVPTLGALLGPDVDWDSNGLEADWTNGMVVTGGFLPSRTYREWGELAVVPTRARLTLRREGQTLRVQNALGARLAEGSVRMDGEEWVLPVLEDGAEGEASPAPSSRKEFLEVVGFSDAVRRRFSGMPWDTLSAPLPEKGFRARLEGPGLAPTSALPVELHEGVHFVLGRVDGP
jgi:hypothetical protein